MAQVLEFKLPDLGEGLTEAEIVRWLVQVGDVVAVDQPVVEVETAKAMVEVPCPYGGVVTARFGEEGTELPVGAPLLTVAVGASAAGGAIDGLGERAAGGLGERGAEGSDAGSGNVLVGYGTGAPPARRRRVRPAPPAAPARAGISREAPAAQPAPSAPKSPVRPAEGHAKDDAVHHDGTRGDGPVPVISPLVRRLARENGLDLRELTGSGPDGLILRADVEYALRAAAAQGRTAQPT
ncbi:biotin/lipoyl-containing protein, partial [Streptomyces sp. PSKA30]|uniref:biotin/lipoyl-containing protein n=1 Tax=Streptomyces sp. PSKA30 TaxID=2874597 RepID=UPI001CD08602